MYRIFIGEDLIYSDQNPDTKYRLTQPVLSMADNQSGSLEFVMDAVNHFYTQMDSATLKDVFVYKDGGTQPYWSGFVTAIQTDFFKRKHVTCVGDLQRLARCTMHDKVNTYQSIATSDDIEVIAQRYVQTILDAYNFTPTGTAKMETSHKIYLGDVTIRMLSKAIQSGTTINIVPYVTSCEMTCLDAIMALQDSHGGHMRIRWSNGNRYLDWYSDYPRQSSQVIRFGVNLLEFAKTADDGDLFTVLYPLGDVLEDTEDITYTVVSGGNTASRKLDTGGNVVSAASAYYVRTNAITLSGNTRYFYSGHMLGNSVIWALYDSTGTVISVELSGAQTSDEIVVIDRREIIIPDGAVTMRVAYYADISGMSAYSKVETVVAADALTEHVTIESVNSGSPYLQTALVGTYGWIEKHMIFEGVNAPQGVLSRANRYLNTYTQTHMCIEVSAIDMRLMGASVDDIRLLDTVRIVSKPHDLDTYMPVTELVIPMAEPDQQTFTLGVSFKRKLSDLVGRKL